MEGEVVDFQVQPFAAKNFIQMKLLKHLEQ